MAFWVSGLALHGYLLLRSRHQAEIAMAHRI